MRFIFLVLLCFLVEAWLPINGQNNAGKATRKKDTAQGQQQNTPNADLLRNSPSNVDKPTSKDQKHGQSDASDPYFKALIAPNNLPNVVLAIVGIFGILVAIGTLNWLKHQTIAIRRQADTMEKQAADATTASVLQAEDVKASIAEAVRSATAMEGVATAMATSAKSVQESVTISKDIAATQKLAIELQGRAYLSVFFDSAFYQDVNHVFEVTAVIRNHGNTPAYDVVFKATAQIVPVPVPEDFAYLLPDDSAGASVSLIAPGTTKLIVRAVPGRISDSEVDAVKRGGPPRALAMWGIVNYRDAFNKTRHIKFAFTVYWQPWVAGMEKDRDGNPKPEPQYSRDTSHHNEAD